MEVDLLDFSHQVDIVHDALNRLGVAFLQNYQGQADKQFEIGVEVVVVCVLELCEFLPAYLKECLVGIGKQ